jgi:hypothetical protein
MCYAIYYIVGFQIQFYTIKINRFCKILNIYLYIIMSYIINSNANYSIVVPAGTIAAYLGTSDPTGWVIMDGVARTNNSDGRYNRLAALGVGSGGTGTASYTPPNGKGAFLRGLGTSSAALKAFQDDELESHKHNVNDPGHGHTTTYGFTSYTGGTTPSRTGDTGSGAGSSGVTSSTTGITLNSSGGTETRPYNVSVNWIIKL